MSEAAAKPLYNAKNLFQALHPVNHKLTGEASEKDTRHHEISLAGSGLVYEAGDALAVKPTNDPALAESLEKANASFEGQDVSFIGINTSDAPETATAFAEQYGVTYPSLMAAQDGAIKLAFADQTPINATPTTLVLDKQGRVAARIIGQLESASILQTLVRDALEES